MQNDNAERKEPIYWTAFQLARAITKESMTWGIKPADVLGALTDGFEKGVSEHRDAVDQSNAGH